MWHIVKDVGFFFFSRRISRFAQKLDTHKNEKGKEALKVINLLDATFDMDLINGMENNKNNNFTVVSDDLASVSAWDSIDSRPWINWNLKSQAVPLTNAARALQVIRKCINQGRWLLNSV